MATSNRPPNNNSGRRHGRPTASCPLPNPEYAAPPARLLQTLKDQVVIRALVESEGGLLRLDSHCCCGPPAAGMTAGRCGPSTSIATVRSHRAAEARWPVPGGLSDRAVATMDNEFRAPPGNFPDPRDPDVIARLASQCHPLFVKGKSPDSQDRPQLDSRPSLR